MRTQPIKIRPNVTYTVTASENTSAYKGVEQGIFNAVKGDSQEIGEGTGTQIFADFLKSTNDNEDIQVVVNKGEFKAFNRKRTKDGSRNTYDLTFTYKKDVTVVKPVGKNGLDLGLLYSYSLFVRFAHSLRRSSLTAARPRVFSFILLRQRVVWGRGRKPLSYSAFSITNSSSSSAPCPSLAPP